MWQSSTNRWQYWVQWNFFFFCFYSPLDDSDSWDRFWIWIFTFFLAAIQIRSNASGLCHVIRTVSAGGQTNQKKKKIPKHQQRMNATRETISDTELSLCFTVLLYYCHSNYYRERLTADGHQRFLQIKPRCRTVTFEQCVNKSNAVTSKQMKPFL